MTKVSTSRRRNAGRGLSRPHSFALTAIAAAALMVLMGFYYQGCGEYPPGPAEAVDADGATDSGPCGNKRKDNLANIWHYAVLRTPIGDFNIFKVTVYTDWGYRPDRFPCSQPGVIRWRHSDPQFTPEAPVGTVWNAGWFWYTSQCYDNGRQCLTRLQARAGWSINIQGQAVNGFEDGCIATRIGPGGDHHRVVFSEKTCGEALGRAARASRDTAVPAGSVVAADDPAALQRAYRRWDQADATIEDYVGQRTSARIHRACSARLDSDQCRNTFVAGLQVPEPGHAASRSEGDGGDGKGAPMTRSRCRRIRDGRH